MAYQKDIIFYFINNLRYISRICLKTDRGRICGILTLTGQVWCMYLMAVFFEKGNQGLPTCGIVPGTVHEHDIGMVQGSVLVIEVVVHLQGRLLATGPTGYLGRDADYGCVGLDIVEHYRTRTYPCAFSDNYIS